MSAQDRQTTEPDAATIGRVHSTTGLAQRSTEQEQQAGATAPAAASPDQPQASDAEQARPSGALTSLDALFGSAFAGGTSCSTDGVCD